MSSRRELQADLLIMFGDLISPLEELVQYPDQQTAQTRAKASAKFTHDRPAFNRFLNTFCTGEPGHNYAVENAAITGRLNKFTNQIVNFRDHTLELKRELDELREEVKYHILAIPCELDTELFDACSPFSAYIKIKSIVECARDKVVFVDPYMGQNVVRRYFNHVCKEARLVVVTKRRTGGQEFGAFIDLSNLCASERGPSKYSLMYHSNLHDRYLQCDDVAYHLGGSIREAGSTSGFTITKVQTIANGQNPVDAVVSESSEQYGLSSNVHPNA